MKNISHENIKKLSISELEKVATQLRETIVDSVSKNGGHLASSLGTVELTIALLKVFDLENDKIIWDVGHQAYPYKILTGRKNRFHTLRTFGGISGFPKMSESPYDFFGTGHGGTSISAVLGIRESQNFVSKNGKVISVIGDGAMTSGLALEAMNNVHEFGKNTITILNDNDMFISTSVGSLSKWFSRKLSGSTYSIARTEVKQILAKLPPFFQGDKIAGLIRKAIDSSKSLLTPGILFEGFGYQYVGPIDGHNIEELIEILEDIKPNREPVLLHVHTVKGKGYEPAEKNPSKFHGIGTFDKKTGKTPPSAPSFTKYLSDYIIKLFRANKNLVAITAAMPDGTGLQKLRGIFPERVYDVGMSEGHAVTFAAGLATGDIRPIVAIYSSFLQRALDSVIHDTALQKLPVIFLVDRAGLVGEDGATHHGLFDISYLRMIPGMILMAPRDEHEMARMIETSLLIKDGPVAIRYPRGRGSAKKVINKVLPLEFGKGELIAKGNKPVLIVSVGIMTNIAKTAVEKLQKKGEDVFLYDLKFIKPLPDELFEIIEKNKITSVVTVEDGIVAGGAGSAILEEFSFRNMDIKCSIIGVKDTFSTHGTQKELRKKEGLTPENIQKKVERYLR
ncbi:MAG TPA: 1-deoxy-D-xylulose-5-phosphate synthase [bacterium]|nr:1-deoxy-D-xylulose-5-phosphate synthase [bacterium]